MATVGKLVVKIGADISGLEKGLNTAAGRLRSFGASMKSLGTGLTLGMSAPLAGVATMAFKSAAAFEQSMNLMQTMSGATAEQMATLQEQALELGASTVFSAGEAAEAMLELNRAGMTVEQTSAAIAGVMDLAAAGQIGLAEAATITANAINAFGLEAGRSAEIANIFAAAANASSSDVQDLADGFSNAGAVFAANGQSVNTLAAALALLSNNGVAGAEAGTALRTVLRALATPTSAAAKTLAELGVSVYDAQGNMRPFVEVIGQMERATEGMADAQRNAALQTIFGAYGISGATILIEEGAAAFTAMEEAVSAQGAAALLADAQMRGLGGAVEYFRGAVDSLLIESALPFAETLALMIRRAADLLERFTELSPGVQRFAAVLLGVLVVAGPLLVVLGTMATALAALMSPVGLVIAGLVLLGALLVANWDTVARFADGVHALGRYLRMAAEDGDALNDWLTHLPGWAQPAALALGKVAAAAHDLSTGKLTWSALGAGLLAELERVPAAVQAWAVRVDWAGLMDSAGDVGASIQGKMEGWFAQAAAGVGTVAADAGPLARGLSTAMASLIKNATARAAALMGTTRADAAQLAGTLRGTLGTLLEDATAQAAALLGTGTSAVAGLSRAVAGWFEQLTWDDVRGAAAGALERLRTTVNGWRDDVLGTVTGWVEGVEWSGLSLDVSGFVDGLAEGLRGLDLKAIPFAEILTAVIGGPLSKGLALVKWVAGSEEFEGLRTAVLDAIAGIDWGGMLESVGGLADAALDFIVEAANEMIQGYIDAITGIDWTQMSLDFAGLLTSISERIQEIDWAGIGASVGESIRALFTGGEEGRGGFFGLAEAVAGAIADIRWGEVLGAAGDLAANLGGAVLELVSSAISGLFGATLNQDGSWTSPQWVTDLTTWLENVMTTPLWVLAIIEWWNNVTSEPPWVAAIKTWWADVTTPPEWVGTLLNWWAEVLLSPAWIATLLDWLGRLGLPPGWIATIEGWLEGLRAFRWPTIPKPAWLASLETMWANRPAWLGGVGAAPAPALPSGPQGQGGFNAVGTPYWPGGWTWVGEQGPELVALPAASRIYSHRASEAMAAAPATVQVGPVYVTDKIDIEALAYRVATINARRGRR